MDAHSKLRHADSQVRIIGKITILRSRVTKQTLLGCITALGNPTSVERPVRPALEQWSWTRPRKTILGMIFRKYFLPLLSLSSQRSYLYLLFREWSLHSHWLGAPFPPSAHRHHHNNPHIIEPLTTDLWLCGQLGPAIGQRGAPRARAWMEMAQWGLCEMKQKLCSIKKHFSLRCHPSLNGSGYEPKQCHPELRHSLVHSLGCL